MLQAILVCVDEFFVLSTEKVGFYKDAGYKVAVS